MPNYDPNDRQQTAQFILCQLVQHKHFVLATTDDDGTPWAVYLGFVLDKNLDFIWLSKRGTEHSKHIRARKTVSVGVFSKTEDIGDFGLYCKATAREITEAEEIKESLQLYFELKGKPVPNVTAFTGDTDMRVYKAEIQQAWVNDDSHIKREVNLQALRSYIDL